MPDSLLLSLFLNRGKVHVNNRCVPILLDPRPKLAATSPLPSDAKKQCGVVWVPNIKCVPRGIDIPQASKSNRLTLSCSFL